jgi:hypothetical protein
MRTAVACLAGLVLTGCAADHWEVVPVQQGGSILLNKTTGQAWLQINEPQPTPEGILNYMPYWQKFSYKRPTTLPTGGT